MKRVESIAPFHQGIALPHFAFLAPECISGHTQDFSVPKSNAVRSCQADVEVLWPTAPLYTDLTTLPGLGDARTTCSGYHYAVSNIE